MKAPQPVLPVLGVAVFLLGACREESAPASPIRFVDRTDAAGIRFRHDNGKSEAKFYAEQMGVGAIFFDADQDGDQDIYLLNGKQLAAEQDPAPVNAFYLNDGTGNFTDATAASGLGDPRFGMGVCGADYDNDGDVDLFVTNFGADNALYRNEGDGTFVDVAADAGVLGHDGLVSSAAFCDVDRDGFVDLYVGYCLDHTLENNKPCKWPRRDGQGAARRYCNPTNYFALPDHLYRNRGDGTFEDVSEAWGITEKGRTLGVAFADYDNDGDSDIVVACDQTPNLYYENDGTGHFRERGLEAGLGVSNDGRVQSGMGIVAGDFDGNLSLDVSITYFEDQRNGFYANQGSSFFRDVERENGTGEPSDPLLAWGTAFFDADLDKDLDVLIANGHFLDNVEMFREVLVGYEQPNLLYENLDNTGFRSIGEQAGPGLAIRKVSRGLAIADVDNDGDLDALVANLHERPDLLINETPREGRHWLSIQLTGTVSNRDAIGTRVTAHFADRSVVRELFTGQSYLSQSELRIHFGLGLDAVVPKLEVRWPTGRTTVLENVPGDQFLRLTEPN